MIVDRHQGSLTCESVDGYGTTFLIRIPIAGTAAADPADPAAAEPAAGDLARIPTELNRTADTFAGDLVR